MFKKKQKKPTNFLLYFAFRLQDKISLLRNERRPTYNHTIITENNTSLNRCLFSNLYTSPKSLSNEWFIIHTLVTWRYSL